LNSMSMHYLKSLLAFILLSFQAHAQLENTVNANMIYVDYIESVQFRLESVALSLPIVDLNSRTKLTLEFDDRDGGFKNYLYRVVHCDKDWYFSNLDEIEYLDGFNDEEIDDFGYSTNTYSEYTHYSLTLPNPDLRWLISGNYMLFIYDEDTELPVLSRRFIVTEKVVNATGTISKPQDISKVRTHHEINVTVNHDNLRITRPLGEIFVSVMQNGNTNSAYHNIQGTYTRGNNIHFDDYALQITYPALKEFRSCDIRSLKFRSEFVHSIEQNDYNTNVLMDLDKKRSNKNFHTVPDANGGYIIENNDYGSGDVSSEYANVIFSLEAERPFLEEVYIVGAVSDWKPKEKFRMDYDAERGIYTKDIELKQGYYDYMYGLLNEDGLFEMDPIEGSWYETDNEYQIIVYYRENGGEYDRVLDVAMISYRF